MLTLLKGLRNYIPSSAAEDNSANNVKPGVSEMLSGNTQHKFKLEKEYLTTWQ